MKKLVFKEFPKTKIRWNTKNKNALCKNHLKSDDQIHKTEEKQVVIYHLLAKGNRIMLKMGKVFKRVVCMRYCVCCCDGAY